MKFLYITPEHVSGTLSLFKRNMNAAAMNAALSPSGIPDSISRMTSVLISPLMPNVGWVRALRTLQGTKKDSSHSSDSQSPLYWSPGTFGSFAFRFRDFLNWPYIEDCIRQFRLNEFDVIQLDGGLDFTRDARFVRACVEQGTHVLCFYHGSDMRSRGIIPEVDRLTSLRLTSEWDLLELDNRLNYLYLPFDTETYLPRAYQPHKPVRICHAARNPFKGTQFVIEAVDRLKSEFPVELILMRDLSYKDALRIKDESDIFIDQLTNEGGWGYGMSSVEALSMGLPVITNIPPQMESRIAPHPFIQADPQTLYKVLHSVLKDPSRLSGLAAKSQAWVRERHDIRRVADHLYSLYEQQGWL